MVDHIVQVGILIFGCLQIWLLSLKRHHINRWGWIAGVVAQPFFLIAYLRGGQWGLMVVWCFYTYAILQGVWNHWIRPTEEVPDT
jgi:hypothetical protein